MEDLGDILREAQQNIGLDATLRQLQQKFFRDVTPAVARISLVDNDVADYPARYVHTAGIIEINSSVAGFQKFCRLLIVHELIHHKLFTRNARYASQPYGPPFREEMEALCSNREFVDLLAQEK